MTHVPNGAPPNSGPMDAERFARYIEVRLSNEETLVSILQRDGMQLQIVLIDQDTPRHIDLRRFHRAYLQNPEQLDAVYYTLLHVLRGDVTVRQERRYEALVQRIYPMLKPIELLVTVRDRNLPMLAYREFLSELIITYVIDEGQSVSYINEDHLEQWEVNLLDLHAQALQNLAQRTKGVQALESGEGDHRLFIFNSGDGYDASRLLLTETLALWAQQLPGRMVIGIPNRDFLIAFSDADSDVLQAVSQQIQLDSMQDSSGLTEQLFTIVDGQVREYLWDE